MGSRQNKEESHSSQPETTTLAFQSSSKTSSSVPTTSSVGNKRAPAKPLKAQEYVLSVTALPSNREPRFPLERLDFESLKFCDIVLQICVVGEGGVGKTSLIQRWCEGQWIEVEPTQEIDFIHKSLNVEGKQAGLQIWDCPGNERNHVPGSYYHGALAVVGIYDVSDETSLTALKKWFDDAVRYAGSDVTRVLVGNKSDGDKVVTSEAARELAKSCEVNLVFEISVKNGTKVASVFEELAKHVTKAAKTV